MSRRSIFLIYFILFFMIIGLACGLARQVAGALKQLTTPATLGAGQFQELTILPTFWAEPVGMLPVSLASAPGEATAVPHQPQPRRPAATPTSNTILGLVSESVDVFTDLTVTPTRPRRLIVLPSVTPTPTHTNTPLPTATPLPTQTLLPTATPAPTQTPLPTATPLPTQAPLPTPVPLPTTTSLPTFTPVPEYDFMLAEFYNSPTTNSFLLIYVAIVDPNEIPIGEMKIVGTRLDHRLTYESPLSKPHYEGYNAPGEVIKTGNVKFEPPGGIETTPWVLHLEDAQGNRQSADIPFDVDANNKQWYFIKFRRRTY